MIRVRQWGSGVVITMLLALVSTAPPVFGQSGTALRISPPNFEIEAEPGQVVAQQIRVSNRGDSTLPISMQIAGFEPTGQEGQVALTEGGQAEFGVVTWTTVTPQEFTLASGDEQVVTFLIVIPDNAPPGGQYMSILASLGSGGTTQGVTVGQRIGALVLLRVTGEVVEQVELTTLGAPALASKGPITFDVVVSNTGNVHVRPAGVITIKDTFGKEIEKLTLEQKNVLPGSERAFSATWDTGWRMGRYTAEYLGFYGAGNIPLDGSISVVIFPWPIALPVLAFMTLLTFIIVRGRKRLARTFRVLVGRE